MSWLSKLFGDGASPAAAQDEAAMIAAFCADLGGSSNGATTAFDGIEALHEAEKLVIVDWADGPEMAAENAADLLTAEPALQQELIDAAIAAGEAINTGRGTGTLPTLCALDDALKSTGTRFLWVNTGGDAYDVARVPDAIWAKWRDVRIGDVTILEMDMCNEYPNQRKLVMDPR